MDKITELISQAIQDHLDHEIKIAFRAGHNAGWFDAGKIHTVESLNRGLELSESYLNERKGDG